MSNVDRYNVLKKPIVFTEKMTLWKEDGLNKIIFEVDIDASKPAIKSAIENLFKVQVLKVNTVIARGKVRRVGRALFKRPNKKKAIVTLAEGQKIEEYFGGV